MYNTDTFNAFEYFMTQIKRFASSNGLVITYNMDFKNKLGTIRLKNCDPIDWAEYYIDWTDINEIDDVQELIKVITDDVRKVFNLKKEEKKKTPSVTTNLKQNLIPHWKQIATYKSKDHNPPYKPTSLPEIKKVIFNKPATIVFWADGTKTVVKCHGDDKYSKDAGLAWCIAKKATGNSEEFIDIFEKWIPKNDDKKSDDFNRGVTYTTRTNKSCLTCQFGETSLFEDPCITCFSDGGRPMWKEEKEK